MPKPITPDEILSQAESEDQPKIDALVETINQHLIRTWRFGEVTVSIKDVPPSVVDGAVKLFREAGWLIRHLRNFKVQDVLVQEIGFSRQSDSQYT